jgi:23S rRNA (uracil1939-C5)-methyltransferase
MSIRLSIEKLVHGGSGLGSIDGKRVFVPFSAPGDVLEVEIVSERPGFSEGRIARIVEPAPCRVDPPCPAFGRCGGCQWQHISYEEQLRQKRAILAEALERTGRIRGPTVFETIPSPGQWHYRNRMQLHVDSHGRVGYYRAGSKEVVEFESCLIADPSINAELAARRGEIAVRGRGIALRADGGEGFAQVNSAQNERLRSLLVEWLGGVPHGAVLEPHAGAGNFTSAIARIAGEVVAADIDGRAVRAGLRRLQGLGIANVRYGCMPAQKAVRRHAAACDAIVLDPPRGGCIEAVEAIEGARPCSIIYISCDPATLARDCRALCERGWRHVRSQPVDMFPQTFHVESLTLLSREA